MSAVGIGKSTGGYRQWRQLHAVTGCYRQLQAVTGCYRQYRLLQAITGSYRQLQHKQYSKHSKQWHVVHAVTNGRRCTWAQQLFGVLVTVVRAKTSKGFGPAVQLQMHQPLHDVGFNVVVVDQLPHVQVQERPGETEQQNNRTTGGYRGIQGDTGVLVEHT